jgi:hypothetical protein
MANDVEQIEEAVSDLVDRYRTRCLWFLRPDFYPSTPQARLYVLEQIQRHGDREGYLEAAALWRWLSRPSSATSAGS